ncbi:hypothetical protein F2Q69_00034916 [Brassica cretica]|uniref:Uncharacterized protein n=1 Tax=Brassica cretica TaxID=69181 RepID=A0A8S9SMF7_BRACR|nr:hypothetical protein F2Q69_00034916 [Brassica cretica]
MSNLSVDAEEALLRSSCKIRAAWALDAGIPWNLWTLRLLAGLVVFGPKAIFRNLWVLDHKAFQIPEFFLRTWNISFKGPYSAILGEATISTCWDFAFCLSEAGHYRVPVLHAASAGSHYQT